MEFVKIDNNFKDKEKLYSLNDEAFPKEERIPSEKLIGVVVMAGLFMKMSLLVLQ